MATNSDPLICYKNSYRHVLPSFQNLFVFRYYWDHGNNLHKKAWRYLFLLVKLTKKQSTAGETKRICYKGLSSLNDNLSADHDERAKHFAEFTVPISSLILTSFKPSQLRHPTNERCTK